MESTYPEICSVSVLFEDTIGLYGGLILRLLALSISCAVLIKFKNKLSAKTQYLAYKIFPNLFLRRSRKHV